MKSGMSATFANLTNFSLQKNNSLNTMQIQCLSYLRPCQGVDATGFEPATSASRTQRSTKLSHASLFHLPAWLLYHYFCAKVKYFFQQVSTTLFLLFLLFLSCNLPLNFYMDSESRHCFKFISVQKFCVPNHYFFFIILRTYRKISES